MSSPFSSMPSGFSPSANPSGDPGAAFSFPSASAPPHFSSGSFSGDPTSANPFTYPSTSAVPHFSSGNTTAGNPFRSSSTSAASQSISGLSPAGNNTASNPFFRDPSIPATSGFSSGSFAGSGTAANPIRYISSHTASDFSSGLFPAGYATSGYPSSNFNSMGRKNLSSSTVRFGSSSVPSFPLSNSPSNTASSFARPYMASATTKTATPSACTSAAVAYSVAKLMTSETTTKATSLYPRPTTMATSDTTSETGTVASATTTAETLSPTSASATISMAASKTPLKFSAALLEARSSFAVHPKEMLIDQTRQLMTTLINMMARGSSAIASDRDAVAEMVSIVSTLLSASLPSSFVGHLGFLEDRLKLFKALPAKLRLALDDMRSKQSEVESLIPELEILEKDFRAMELKEVDLDSTIRVAAQEVKDLEERLMAAKDKLRILQSRRASVASAKSDCLFEGHKLEKRLTKALSAETAAIRTLNSVKRRQEMADAQWQIILEGLQASLPQLS